MNNEFAFTLYTTQTCPFTARIKVLIALKKLNVNIVDPSEIGFDKYKEIVSVVRIPAIETSDGIILVESEAICEFIEDQFPTIPCFPSDPMERYRLRLISRRADLDLASSLSPLGVMQQLGGRDERIVKMIRTSGRKALIVLNELLGQRSPYAMGENLSHVDGVLLTRLHIIEQMWSLHDIGDPFEEFDSVKIYRKALSDNDTIASIERPYLSELTKAVAAMRSAQDASCEI